MQIDADNVINDYMKTTYHHGKLRAALIEAAAAVAARSGVAQVRMRGLARELGVSSGAPFRHFATLDALLIAVAETGADRQLEAIEAAVDPSAPPHEQQRQAGIAYVRWAVAEPGYFRVLSRAESLAGSAQLQAQHAAFTEGLQAALGGDPPASGPDLPVGPVGPALAARALVHGLACLAVDGLLGNPLSPDDAATLAELVFRHIRVGSPETQ